MGTCVIGLIAHIMMYDLGEIEVSSMTVSSCCERTALYYELAMKVPIPVGITVNLLTWGLGHLRCLVIFSMEAMLYKWPAFEKTGSVPELCMSLTYHINCNHSEIYL